MTREEALKEVEGCLTDYFPLHCYEEVEEIMKALKQEPCEDAISRQAVLEPYKYLKDDDVISIWLIKKNIEQQKSVIPIRPKGHWKVVSDGYGDNAYICECSECKDTVWVYKDADRKWNYCPNCGAKMESEVSK